MILDFSIPGFSISSIKYNADWQRDIIAFLKEYQNDLREIIVQTSGSTGKPKALKIQKKFMVNSARMTGSFFNIKQGQTALLCLPVQYIAAKMMLVRAVELKLRLICVKPSSNPLKTVKMPIDFCAMVPMQVEHSIDLLNNIKQLIIGGARVPENLEASLQPVKTQCFATYGMTETVSHIAMRKLNGQSKSKNYKILNGISIKQDDRNCLVVDCPHLSNKQIITNDMVEIYGEKEFQFIGRYDNIINSGAVKIIPEQLEKKLVSLIACRFFIAGLPDDLLGEKVVLVIESTKPLTQVNFEKHLTRFEIPKAVFYIKNFSETASGKIDRKKTLEFTSSSKVSG